ncbi:hypothetical protein C2E21_5522 [Chlorella sorokiniana]|uniref:Spore protein YkvP/CgeB glycosyl transferase-like domain-containing protein n=1 Tax=Chlorella sorokiniana TaxID=3076 RepID=A0A2P6TNJ5_CHLSO|nr:hypothetical protein C2E21_5522 [Chlorella sorokiniana]|eukprot:PRW50908.1 hypothetical protein C2E21_5522 [Chlorella sorokiniana]
MAKQQHREAAGRATRVTVVQAALVGLVLLALGWSWQRPAAPVPQQLPAGPREPYITDLVLPLDVGTLAQQAEADAWCSTRTQLSWPPTPQQLRSLRVAIVVDPVCRPQEYVSADALATCLDAIVSHCKDLAKTGCFGGWSGKLEECKGVLPAETLPDGTKPPQKWNHYQFWWQTIMTTAAPQLRAMGWSNLKILSDAKSANERRMASCADLLITSTTMFWQLYPFKHGMRPHQKMILIEQYGAGTFMLPPDMEAGVESNNTIAVVKHVLVDPPEKQNGPFLEERSHLALMVKDRPELLTVRERPWQQSTLDKMEVLLPMTVRFSNPIQCGGSWGFARYHGFFTKNEKRWPIPPLASRPYDVTFIGKLEYEAKAEVSGVTLHRQAAVKALSAFRDKWGHQYKVYVPQGERLEYHEYVGLLKQSKIVISPWGWGEWSHKDFEILMAGCVVVKPRSDIFRIHPAIFEHNVTAITTKEDLSDLEEQILPFLRDVPRAQAMATRVQGLWRQYARPDQLAQDWDELMLRRLGASIKSDLRQQYEGLGGGLELGGEPAGQESLPPAGEKPQPLGAAEQERQAEEAEEEGEPDESGDSQAADGQQQAQREGGDDRR